MKKVYLFLFYVFVHNVAGSKSTDAYNGIYNSPDPASVSENAHTLNSNTSLEISMEFHNAPVQIRGEECINKNNVQLRWQIITE